MASRYFADTPEQRQAREETIRNMRWALGEGEAAADTGMRGGSITGIGRQQVDLRNDPQALERMAQPLEFFREAPVGVLRGNLNSSEEMGYLFARPDTQYRLISGGEVIGTANTPEEAMALVQQANTVSSEGGRKANVMVQQAMGDNWETLYHNAPNQSTLGAIADIGLPLALSFTPLGPIAGAALGSGISSVAQGRSLGDTLLRAGIAGGTAFGIGQIPGLGGAVSGGAGNIAGSAASGAASGAVGSAAANSLANAAIQQGIESGLINVVKSSLGSNIASNALASGLSSALSGAATAPQQAAPVDGGVSPEIAVGGARIPAPQVAVNPNAIAGSVVPNLPEIRYLVNPNEGGSNIVEGGESPEIVVTQNPYIPKLPEPTLGIGEIALGLGGLGALGTGLSAAAPGPGVVQYTPPPSTEAIQANAAGIADAPELLVTAAPTGATGSLGVALPGLAMTLPAMTAASAVAPGSSGGGLGGIGGIASGVAGGASILSGLAGLLGVGGGSNAGGGAGIGGFNPNPGLVTYQPLNRTQNAITFDPFTYGQSGGEFRFFNDTAPQFQINQPTTQPAMIAPDNANVPRFKEGGRVRKGIGSLGEAILRRESDNLLKYGQSDRLSSEPVSWRDSVIDALSERIGRRNAERLAMIADVSPLGVAMMGNEARIQYDKGNKGAAVAMMAAGTLPAAIAGIGGARRIARSVEPKTDFSGTLNLLHGQKLPIVGMRGGPEGGFVKAAPKRLEFKDPAEIPEDSRYDGNVFGNRAIYLAQPGDSKWYNGELRFDSDVIHNVEGNFNKAFVLTPKTLNKFKNLVGVGKNPNNPWVGAEEKLRAAGYDGIIVHGMDDYISGGMRSPGYMEPGYEDFVRSYESRMRKLSKRHGIDEESLSHLQDQVVAFQPKNLKAGDYVVRGGPDSLNPEWSKLLSTPKQGVPNFASGGPVRGIGGGQDDLIDAKLSDGEYVFSAQDVADLGDGSNEAGARKLDQMRKLIRKQAGRKNLKTIAPPQKSVRSILKAVVKAAR